MTYYTDGETTLESVCIVERSAASRGWNVTIPLHYADGTPAYPDGCSGIATKKEAENWARQNIESLSANKAGIVECQRLYPGKPVFKYIKK